MSTRGARLPNRSGAGGAAGGGLSGRERVGVPAPPSSLPASLPEVSGTRAAVIRSPGGEEAMRNVLGRRLSDREIAGLVGAQPGDRVFIGGQQSNKQVALQLVGRNYDYVAARGIYRDVAGNLTLRNQLLFVAQDRRGSGIGTKLLRDQIRTATRLGVKRIELEAGRGPVPTWEFYDRVPGITEKQAERLGGSMTGYSLWPQRGFSTHIRESELRSMPADLRRQLPAVDPQFTDLVRARGGIEWLREHGDQRGMTFDLIRGSASRQVLARYLSVARHHRHG